MKISFDLSCLLRSGRLLTIFQDCGRADGSESVELYQFASGAEGTSRKPNRHIGVFEADGIKEIVGGIKAAFLRLCANMLQTLNWENLRGGFCK